MNETDWENNPFLDDGFKTQAAVYLGVVIVFLIISSQNRHKLSARKKPTRLDLIFTFRSSAASSQNPNEMFVMQNCAASGDRSADFQRLKGSQITSTYCRAETNMFTINYFAFVKCSDVVHNEKMKHLNIINCEQK